MACERKKVASNNDQLDKLVATVLASPKNRSVSADLIRRIGSRELTTRRNVKDAVKATKNKLHQVAGAYLDTRIRYGVWLDELRRSYESGNRDAFLSVCTSVMAYHSSTRERLPILNQFYRVTLAEIGPIHSVIDVACGLNPLAIPWMNLPRTTSYYAYDVHSDLIEFLNSFMTMTGIDGHAEVHDALQPLPVNGADVAFVLKALPCLEQIDKAAGAHLLETINSSHILVSFPIHSLGDRKKGMTMHYESRFSDMVANNRWSIQKFDFSTELVFLVNK